MRTLTALLRRAFDPGESPEVSAAQNSAEEDARTITAALKESRGTKVHERASEAWKTIQSGTREIGGTVDKALADIDRLLDLEMNSALSSAERRKKAQEVIEKARRDIEAKADEIENVGVGGWDAALSSGLAVTTPKGVSDAALASEENLVRDELAGLSRDELETAAIEAGRRRIRDDAAFAAAIRVGEAKLRGAGLDPLMFRETLLRERGGPDYQAASTLRARTGNGRPRVNPGRYLAASTAKANIRLKEAAERADTFRTSADAQADDLRRREAALARQIRTNR